jgi:putative exosortase-associated protein (TIGR04073 family)
MGHVRLAPVDSAGRVGIGTGPRQERDHALLVLVHGALLYRVCYSGTTMEVTMPQRVTVTAVVAAALLVACPLTSSAEPMESNGMVKKAMRGATNTVTGWVEIPKRIHETTVASGYGTGFTWGLLRGLGYGFIRTAAGLYELVTFPFPAPPGYESVIQPEYVFTDLDNSP